MTENEPQHADPGRKETFGARLVTQHLRTDWVGDLARAAKADRKFPREADQDAVREHLNGMQAESEILEARWMTPRGYGCRNKPGSSPSSQNALKADHFELAYALPMGTRKALAQHT